MVSLLVRDFDIEPIIFQSGASSGAEAGESDDGTSAREDRERDRAKISLKNGAKTRRRRIRKISVPEMLSPPKPRKPPFTIESAMSSIFKKKKHNKNEIEDVVIEKVIASEVSEPLSEQQQQQQQQQQDQIVNAVELNSEKKIDTKTEPKKGLKTRFLFSLSRTKRDELNLTDNMSDKDQAKNVELQMPKRDSLSSENNGIPQSNHVTTNGGGEKVPTNDTDSDILCVKPILNKKRWSRRTKSSPPPPPPSQTKSNGISFKAPAPMPPIPTAPETNLSSSPEPPPLAPKGLKPVTSSMTSLRSQAPQPNGIPPNGRTSQPVTPATEKRSENNSLVTKLRQGDEGHNGEGQMLLRSGLEAGTDDVTDLRHEEEAGMQEDKSKRKNAQVFFHNIHEKCHTN